MVDIKKIVNYNWYDGEKGWELTNPGWYEKTIDVSNSTDTDGLEKYMEIVEWIYAKLDNCEKHCRWKHHGHVLLFRFRYERDFTWFNLRWG